MSRTTPSFCLFALLLLLVVIGNAFALVWSGTHLRWAPHCDFIGKNLEHQLSPADRCGPLCQATHSCTHFTWTNHEVNVHYSLFFKYYHARILGRNLLDENRSGFRIQRCFQIRPWSSVRIYPVHRRPTTGQRVERCREPQVGSTMRFRWQGLDETSNYFWDMRTHLRVHPWMQPFHLDQLRGIVEVFVILKNLFVFVVAKFFSQF